MRSLILLLIFLALIAVSAWTVYFVNSRNISDNDNNIAVNIDGATASPTPTATPTATPVATATPKAVATAAPTKVAVSTSKNLPKAGAVDGAFLIASAATLGAGALAIAAKAKR